MGIFSQSLLYFVVLIKFNEIPGIFLLYFLEYLFLSGIILYILVHFFICIFFTCIIIRFKLNVIFSYCHVTYVSGIKFLAFKYFLMLVWGYIICSRSTTHAGHRILESRRTRHQFTVQLRKTKHGLC